MNRPIRIPSVVQPGDKVAKLRLSTKDDDEGAGFSVRLSLPEAPMSIDSLEDGGKPIFLVAESPVVAQFRGSYN